MSQSSTTSTPDTPKSEPLPLPFVDRIDDYDGECATYYARTRREQRMCALLNAVRDKPFWARKWREPELRAKLTAEMQEAASATSWPVPVVGRLRRVDSDDDDDDDEFMDDRILEGPMPDADFAYVLKELDWEAENQPMLAGTDGVFALDDAVPKDVLTALVQQVHDLLENVPDHRKDWHPRSNNQVLDLVHPSLYPLVYGRTRVLDAPMTNLNDWRKFISGGTPKPAGSSHDEIFHQYTFLSEQFQWLPSDFAVDGDGKVTIKSYINNLHPEWHAPLYPTLARVFECALPLLEQVLGRVAAPTPGRIDPDPFDWYDSYDEDDTENNKYSSWDDWYENRVPNLPDPADEFDVAGNSFTPYSLRGRMLKVITKLANIHLTPSDPTYPGGSWHIEGMLNEAIVATALYYYDVDNITESHLEFRTGVKPPGYEQSDDRGISFAYALYRDGPLVQPWGHISARQGRMVAFPNMYQHHVAPFELADKTRAGHRKIVAFFLVDPSSPIGEEVVSTSRVPPQQADWIADAWAKDGQFPLAAGRQLPREMIDAVVKKIDGVMTLDEAKELRLELMDERTSAVGEIEELAYSGATYNLCEH